MITPYGFVPKLIPDLLMHFECGVADTVVSTKVTAIQDLSGRGNHVTGASGRQPTIQANAVNGHVGWLPDTVTLMSGSGQPFTPGAPLTVFTVARMMADAGAGIELVTLVTRTSGATSNLIYFGSPHTNGSFSACWFSAAGQDGGTALMESNPTGFAGMPLILCHGATNTATAPTCRINGSNQVTITARAYASDTGALPFAILGAPGGSDPSPVCEIIVYQRALSAVEMAIMHRYLGTKYAIAVQGLL